MTLDAPDGCLPTLAALLCDKFAVRQARSAARNAPAPQAAELRQMLDALAQDPDEADVPLTGADLQGPGPTDEEKRAARYSREAERLEYARRGQVVRYGRSHATARECQIANDLVRRREGLSFEAALALLRHDAPDLRPRRHAREGGLALRYQRLADRALASGDRASAAIYARQAREAAAGR